MKQRDQKKQPGKPSAFKRKVHVNDEEWSYQVCMDLDAARNTAIKNPAGKTFYVKIPIYYEGVLQECTGEIYPSKVKEYILQHLV